MKLQTFVRKWGKCSAGRNGHGRDGRIGPKFLHAGPGFGGSCFPKDTKALVQIAEKHGVQMSVVNAVIEANERQKKMVAEKLEKFAGD